MKSRIKSIVGVSTVLLLAVSLQAEIKITADRNGGEFATVDFKFKNVPSPSRSDAATKARFILVDGRRDSNGGDLDKLHDGKVPTEDDQPTENFFCSAGTDGGRLLVDLGGAIGVKQVNTYSWHPGPRGPQVYTLYASGGTVEGFDPQPKKGTDPQQCGWKLLAQVDTTEAPDLTDWAHNDLAPVVREWYPRLVKLLPSEGYDAPRQVSITFSASMQGVAATGGTCVRCAAGWFRRNLQGEAKGAVVHELAHVVQNYGLARRNNPNATRTLGWSVEGICDYIRWFL